MNYQIETFPVGLFQCNCSILSRDDTKDAIIVDPGDDFEFIKERILSSKLRVKYLWHTHAHLDHVGATLPLLEWLTKQNENMGLGPPEVLLHTEDKWLYDNIELQSKMLGLPNFQVPKDFKHIKDSSEYKDFPKVKSIHTPGHTPGSCCLIVNSSFEIDIGAEFKKGISSDGEKLIFTGDTLFRRSIGRTDLWGGNDLLIQKSIQNKIYSLDSDTHVVPGHGPLTTLEEEKEKNPFVKSL